MSTRPKRPHVFGPARDQAPFRGGGCMPVYRTTYTKAQREALNALAESNPTPERYATERARILEEVP